MRLDAFIFDMDGVIIVTVEFHYLSWQRLANEEGFLFNRKINDQLRGLNRPAPMKVFLEANGMNASPEQIEEWEEQKNHLFRRIDEKYHHQRPAAGTLDLIHEMKAIGIKVAIGSGSKNDCSSSTWASTTGSMQWLTATMLNAANQHQTFFYTQPQCWKYDRQFVQSLRILKQGFKLPYAPGCGRLGSDLYRVWERHISVTAALKASIFHASFKISK